MRKEVMRGRSDMKALETLFKAIEYCITWDNEQFKWRDKVMSKIKFLVFMCLAMAVAVFAWSSGDAAKKQATKEVAKQEVTKPVGKVKVTRDDVARYLGKVTPSEQKAAAKRARQLGLKPGVAGFTAQAPGSGASR